MMIAKLTNCGRSAIRPYMLRYVPIVLLAGLGASCVTVEAPEKPIVIELNINIKQEVVYRLDDDAKALIESEKEIF